LVALFSKQKPRGAIYNAAISEEEGTYEVAAVLASNSRNGNNIYLDCYLDLIFGSQLQLILLLLLC
jgi:hypothetical protein